MRLIFWERRSDAGIIFALLVIDPVSATLWIGACAAFAGWIVVRDSDEIGSLRLSGAVALTLAFAAAAHTGLAASGKSHLGVFWAKGVPQTGPCSSAGTHTRG